MTDGKQRQGAAHNIFSFLLSFIFNELERFLREFTQEYFSCFAAPQNDFTPISCVQVPPTPHPQAIHTASLDAGP
jgi:hypothetical protein